MVLPDLLQPGLRLVVCGMAAGHRAAAVGAYYPDRRNQFYAVLHRTGLTPVKLNPADYPQLLKYGIGLTDLVKDAAGRDAQVKPTPEDIACLREKIERYQPRVLAFNGKRAARAFFGHLGSLAYGRHERSIGGTAVFVLPSTAGGARRWWAETYWADLAAFITGGRAGSE